MRRRRSDEFPEGFKLDEGVLVQPEPEPEPEPEPAEQVVRAYDNQTRATFQFSLDDQVHHVPQDVTSDWDLYHLLTCADLNHSPNTAIQELASTEHSAHVQDRAGQPKTPFEYEIHAWSEDAFFRDIISPSFTIALQHPDGEMQHLMLPFPNETDRGDEQRIFRDSCINYIVGQLMQLDIKENVLKEMVSSADPAIDIDGMSNSLLQRKALELTVIKAIYAFEQDLTYLPNYVVFGNYVQKGVLTAGVNDTKTLLFSLGVDGKLRVYLDLYNYSSVQMFPQEGGDFARVRSEEKNYFRLELTSNVDGEHPTYKLLLVLCNTKFLGHLFITEQELQSVAAESEDLSVSLQEAGGANAVERPAVVGKKWKLVVGSVVLLGAAGAVAVINPAAAAFLGKLGLSTLLSQSAAVAAPASAVTVGYSTKRFFRRVLGSDKPRFAICLVPSQGQGAQAPDMVSLEDRRLSWVQGLAADGAMPARAPDGDEALDTIVGDFLLMEPLDLDPSSSQDSEGSEHDDVGGKAEAPMVAGLGTG